MAEGDLMEPATLPDYPMRRRNTSASVASFLSSRLTMGLPPRKGRRVLMGSIPGSEILQMQMITEDLSKLLPVKLSPVGCAGLRPKVGREKSKKIKSRERSSGGQKQNSFWNPFIGVIEG